jgi:transcriptional regulator with XRE-family HTH domain
LITPAQIRAARHLASLSQAEIAKTTGLSLPTIKRAESERVVPISEDSIAAIRSALEAAGVEFTNGDQPGVRMRRQEADGPPPFAPSGVQKYVPGTSRRPPKRPRE